MAPAEHASVKKRKHDGEHKDRSPKKPKKEKDAPAPAPTKRKKDKSKGKERAAAAGPSEFRYVQGETVISIPPSHAGNPVACANEMLDSMMMRYIPALEGVMLAHSDLRFLQEKASLVGACPFAVCTIGFRALVWGPTIGMKLKGKISLCSPDHVSLLVHRTFNVSIPRHHIPTDDYEFMWGAAPNDPEFGLEAEDDATTTAAAPAEDDDEPAEVDVDASKNDRWIRRDNGELLGDETGHLEFTVIGLKLANQMLSLVGSIQEDPFSPAHVPVAAITDASMDVDPPAPEASLPTPEPTDKEKEKKKRKKDKKRKAGEEEEEEAQVEVDEVQPETSSKKKRKKKDKEAAE
ncbi:hypothetical protein EXIGLDRAFT_711428 [Exidia glandulosa HHB12029]|uniref:RPA43 OB domain-containing protein n=1 Tax=Exidia glandulosa HHB12029 TaxID=1314781 RepID=A0A165N5X1_EXIGL|nr:hypothetical protein EXIGLDRAFT_711428 [Exidia glandulosa HHB12029]